MTIFTRSRATIFAHYCLWATCSARYCEWLNIHLQVLS